MDIVVDVAVQEVKSSPAENQTIPPPNIDNNTTFLYTCLFQYL
jgi:hypothetical protein